MTVFRCPVSKEEAQFLVSGIRFPCFDPLTVLRARQIARVQGSVERLDDEIYEAAVNGREARVRYLEFVRERVPEWLAAGEARSEALRRGR